METIVALENFNNIKENDVLRYKYRDKENVYDIYSQDNELIYTCNPPQFVRTFKMIHNTYLKLTFWEYKKSLFKKKTKHRYDYVCNFDDLSNEGRIVLIQYVYKYVYRLKRLDNDILLYFKNSLTGTLNDLIRMYHVLDEKEFIKILKESENLFKEMCSCANSIYLKIDKDMAESNESIIKNFEKQINIRTQFFKELSV